MMMTVPFFLVTQMIAQCVTASVNSGNSLAARAASPLPVGFQKEHSTGLFAWTPKRRIQLLDSDCAAMATPAQLSYSRSPSSGAQLELGNSDIVVALFAQGVLLVLLALAVSLRTRTDSLQHLGSTEKATLRGTPLQVLRCTAANARTGA